MSEQATGPVRVFHHVQPGAELTDCGLVRGALSTSTGLAHTTCVDCLALVQTEKARAACVTAHQGRDYRTQGERDRGYCLDCLAEVRGLPLGAAGRAKTQAVIAALASLSTAASGSIEDDE